MKSPGSYPQGAQRRHPADTSPAQLDSLPIYGHSRVIIPLY